MNPGDIIARRILLAGLVLPLWHFGVLVAPDRVVHMQPGSIVCVRFTAFSRGMPVIVTHRPPDPAQTIARAKGRIGERGTYDPLHHNCLHFADWCAQRSRASGRVWV